MLYQRTCLSDFCLSNLFKFQPKTNLEDGFDTESAHSIVPESPPTCAEMWPHFKDVLFGTVPGLARTANITHVLGNVTVIYLLFLS